jgi:hypothetical protein
MKNFFARLLFSKLMRFSRISCFVYKIYMIIKERTTETKSVTIKLYFFDFSIFDSHKSNQKQTTVTIHLIIKVEHTRLTASNNWFIFWGNASIECKYSEHIRASLSSAISNSLRFLKPKILTYFNTLMG